jgi:hypothetical protein
VAAEQVVDENPHARPGLPVCEAEALPRHIREAGDAPRITAWQDHPFFSVCKGGEECPLPGERRGHLRPIVLATGGVEEVYSGDMGPAFTHSMNPGEGTERRRGCEHGRVAPVELSEKYLEQEIVAAGDDEVVRFDGGFCLSPTWPIRPCFCEIFTVESRISRGILGSESKKRL